MAFPPLTAERYCYFKLPVSAFSLLPIGTVLGTGTCPILVLIK